MEFNYVNFGFLFLMFWLGFFLDRYLPRIKDWIIARIGRNKNG